MVPQGYWFKGGGEKKKIQERDSKKDKWETYSKEETRIMQIYVIVALFISVAAKKEGEKPIWTTIYQG